MERYNNVIATCNKYTENPDTLWKVYILDTSKPVGRMLEKFVFQMKWTETKFFVSKETKEIHLTYNNLTSAQAIKACCEEFVGLCEKNVADFEGFGKWLAQEKNVRDYHTIRGLDAKYKGIKVPSPLRGIFGIVTTGVHMTMYTIKKVEEKDELFVWVSQRSKYVTTYAEKLDQVVAGGMEPKDDMDPLRTLQREAGEEAGLHLDVSSLTMKYKNEEVGKVTEGTSIMFYDRKGEVAGSETGHLEPGLRYTYDLKVHEDFVPECKETKSIEGFYLKSVKEVQKSLEDKEWKPNCGLVMLDFLIRKKQLKGLSEEQFEELKAGLQRKLPFQI